MKISVLALAAFPGLSVSAFAGPLLTGRTSATKLVRSKSSPFGSPSSLFGYKETYDTVIIGSGPAGSTFARALSTAGKDIPGVGKSGDKKVLMVDAGQKFSEKAGEHVKNSLLYQMDHAEGKRRFAQYIAATFVPISADKDDGLITAEPIATQPGLNTPNPSNWAMNLQNPEQDPYINLKGASVSYKVGGMGSHWTCSCPRPHPTMEANDLFPSDDLYKIAEGLLNVNQNTYNDEIRNVLVGDRLATFLKGKLDSDYPPQNLPLAVQRVNEQFVDWTGPSVILSNLAEPDLNDESFTLMTQKICKRLHFCEGGTGDVEYAELFDPKTGETTNIYADTFVVACGQVASAQLLAASNYTGSTAVGKYLCTQPMFFSRVALRKEIIENVSEYPKFASVIKAWQTNNPNDPIPIPRSGKGSGEIQQWIPVSKGHPWHTQVHIDNFYYGASDATPLDDRLICGLRSFAIPNQVASNYVEFSKTNKDMMGMPQATFHYEQDMSMADLIHDMGKDCADLSFELGTVIPTKETMIQYLPDGSALHLHGCNRIGRSTQDSVCNENGKVWGTNNLYLGGNGCIPNGIACNPTLTSVALAVRAAMDILGESTANTFHKPEKCGGVW